MPSSPVIPLYITVHLGTPGQAAENITILFTDYIKNVASNEIYPTWPEAAIRANMLAQISYALNRVYTEYYRSRGYDFDITSTTQFDQIYVPSGVVFDNIGLIADDIFNNYIVRQGNIEPLFAAFCDGVRTQCQGLSQWGSVTLAEQGYITYEILQQYYGSDINIVYNAPVGDSVPSYPGIPLRRGAFGEEIRTIQLQLNRIRNNYPAIPLIPFANGVLDSPTEASVRVFQSVFNLTVDGVVGKATWYKIKEIWTGVKQLSSLASEGLTITESQRIYPSMLRFGDSGEYVRAVQYYLAFLGYFLPDLPPIAITGTYDTATRDAVFTFQSRYNLAVDGIVGRETWIAIQEAYRQLIRDLPEDYQSFIRQVYPGRVLVAGDTGESVEQVQENLRRIAQSDPSIPAVAVTGTYDGATQAAVLALQRQLGYEETGAVGPALWVTLVERGSRL